MLRYFHLLDGTTYCILLLSFSLLLTDRRHFPIHIYNTPRSVVRAPQQAAEPPGTRGGQGAYGPLTNYATAEARTQVREQEVRNVPHTRAYDTNTSIAPGFISQIQ